jgi:hypothetical protein
MPYREAICPRCKELAGPPTRLRRGGVDATVQVKLLVPVSGPKSRDAQLIQRFTCVDGRCLDRRLGVFKLGACFTRLTQFFTFYYRKRGRFEEIFGWPIWTSGRKMPQVG